jgi:hypothetical protein
MVIPCHHDDLYPVFREPVTIGLKSGAITVGDG